MIRITNSEYVKTKGEFRVDGLHVKRYHFDFPTTEVAKQNLNIEAVPFTYMDDGSRMFYNDRFYKIYISDIDSFLVEHKGIDAILDAYFYTEKAITELINLKYPLLNANWDAPN